MKIVGAGLAGLIAAHSFPNCPIIEAAEKPTETHKALLRFRSDAVSRLTGIEFKSVTVRKGIYDLEARDFSPPTIQLANQYSSKCLGGRIEGNRSIWSLEPVTRYIAPENLYERLLENVGHRVHWNTRFVPEKVEPTISTMPLPALLSSVGAVQKLEFERSPIVVKRFRVPKCDAYQTVYFPSPRTTLYRASISGDLLIAEFTSEPGRGDEWDWIIDDVFSLDGKMVPLDSVPQKYGKIAPIDEGIRRALVCSLTESYKIYSLGRFATWRNLLLDDVVNDVAVIKKLLVADSHEKKMMEIKNG